MRDRWNQLLSTRNQIEELAPADFARWAIGKCESVFRHHYGSPLNSAYRSLCEERGVDPGHLCWSDLPVVDKEFLRVARYAAKPAWSGPTVITSTSGTTSSSIEVPHTYRSARTGLGDNFLRALVKGGAGPLDRHWGIEHRIGPESVTGSQLSMRYLRRWSGPRALITATHKPFKRQIDRAASFDPWSVSSSPGFLTRLALESSSQDRIRPRVVLFGGAPLDEGARRQIEAFFRPDRVIGFFPTTDAGAVGVSTDGGLTYETFSETHWVEVLDDSGAHVAEGEVGSLVITNFDNLAAPLVRYRLGDEVRFFGWRRNRLLLGDITRQAEAAIGGTLIPLRDVAMWTARLQRLDPAVTGVQLVRRTSRAGIDQPIIRVVAPGLDERVREAAVGLLDDFPQVLHEIASGEVGPALVEHVPPQIAMAGIFKLPLYVDERRPGTSERKVHVSVSK